MMSNQSQKSNGIAALLSLIIPGAGQMYKEKVGQGIGWLIFVVFGYFVFFVPGLVLHLICVFAAASENQTESNQQDPNSIPQIVINGVIQDKQPSEQSAKSPQDFVEEIKKAFELRSRDIISVSEYVSSKSDIIEEFCSRSVKPSKNDFLMSIVPLIESEVLSKDDIQKLKDSYSKAA